VQCGIVAATLIERVRLHHVARPRVVDDEHLERLDDVVGVYMGPMALEPFSRRVAMLIVAGMYRYASRLPAFGANPARTVQNNYRVRSVQRYKCPLPAMPMLHHIQAPGRVRSLPCIPHTRSFSLILPAKQRFSQRISSLEHATGAYPSIACACASLPYLTCIQTF